MTLDALAGERQFIDHLAPVWHALPASVRGEFLVTPELVEHAVGRGIKPVAIPRPDPNPAYPKPRFDGPPCLVASYGDVKVGRRLGYGPFAFIEHGIAQTYTGDRSHTARSGSYSGGGDRDDNLLFMVPNDHAAAAWRKAYPDARVEIVGCPRLDDLPSRETGRAKPVIALSFHWNASSISREAETALGEYVDHFAGLAERWQVIGHAHPKGDWPQIVARYYRRAGIPVVEDFDDVLRQADLYVCDNSSTLYEFASTGRPVVVLNSKHYRRNIHHGLRFWEAADVGFQCDAPDELDTVIRLALDDPPEQQEARERALDVVYAYRSGGAQRAADALVSWLDERGERAAA